MAEIQPDGWEFRLHDPEAGETATLTVYPDGSIFLWKNQQESVHLCPEASEKLARAILNYHPLVAEPLPRY